MVGDMMDLRINERIRYVELNGGCSNKMSAMSKKKQDVS